jgi:hypothetical protein
MDDLLGGGTGYERGAVWLELMYLVCDRPPRDNPEDAAKDGAEFTLLEHET